MSTQQRYDHSLEFSVNRYRQQVEALAREGSSTVFRNGAASHASVIFETFFRHAEKSVHIFANKLSSAVFGHDWMVKCASEAVDRGVGISVITQDTPESNPFTDWLANNKSHPGIAFKTHARQNPEVGGRLQCNFAVMDGRAYRFEEDAARHEAVACMHDDTGIAEKLELMFRRLEAA